MKLLLEMLLQIHFLHVFHKRILAIKQIEIHTNHVVDVCTSLYFYVPGLTI